MPVQTRANAPINRVYNSPAAQQQVRFRPTKQLVTYRRSLGASHQSRQQTLTQIDFVNLPEALDQEDEEEYINYEEEENSRKRKRRRTDGDAPSSSSKFYTQTLTQLEFVSTPASRIEDSADLESNFGDGFTDVKPEEDISPVSRMGPPRTPSHRRVYEVPSSQSPFSPVSTRSLQLFTSRSPLKSIDANLRLQSMSPMPNQKLEGSPSIKLESQGVFEYENESQQSRVPQTPNHTSSPTESPQSTELPRLTNSIQTYFKDEIRDSDEEDDYELESYFDHQDQESQVEQNRKQEPSSQFVANTASNPSPSDTQEAENQLQTTILQFTQQNAPITAVTEEGEQDQIPFVRPSQATTVSQSQPLTSSPVFLRRPQEYLEEVFPGEDQDLDEDQDDREWQEGEDEHGVTKIPDSPSQRLASDSPWLPFPSKIRSSRGNRPRHPLPSERTSRQNQHEESPRNQTLTTTASSYKAAFPSSSSPLSTSRPRPRPRITTKKTTRIQRSSSSSATTPQRPNNISPTSPPPLPPPISTSYSFLPSPQLLTRSQLLPDSLMDASIPPPPPPPPPPRPLLQLMVEDSDFED